MENSTTWTHSCHTIQNHVVKRNDIASLQGWVSCLQVNAPLVWKVRRCVVWLHSGQVKEAASLLQHLLFSVRQQPFEKTLIFDLWGLWGFLNLAALNQIFHAGSIREKEANGGHSRRANVNVQLTCFSGSSCFCLRPTHFLYSLQHWAKHMSANKLKAQWVCQPKPL